MCMSTEERLAEIKSWLAWKKVSFAEQLRFAAMHLICDAEENGQEITSAEFGDLCEMLGLHRQGARNRFNEARNNMMDAAS
jgi:hypothetical protein